MAKYSVSADQTEEVRVATFAEPEFTTRIHPHRVDEIVLGVSDLERSVAFYQDSLGFEVESAETDRVVFNVGNARLVLESLPDGEVPEPRGQGVRVYFAVRDVHGHFHQVREMGVTPLDPNETGYVLIEEPVTQPWGYREYRVEDPDGYQLFFRQRVEAGE